MGFRTYARRVRDERLPLARRYAALRRAVGHYCPLGFHATWAYLAATACPSADLRTDPAAMLRALDTLEASREVRLAEVRALADRRSMEKAAGRRTPRPVDTAFLRGLSWPGDTAPSRPGLIAAVANRHAAFQRFPFPDRTLCDDTQAQQLAGLRACLDACARSYLRDPGRMDRATRQVLAGTVDGIQRRLRPGNTPLNTHLLEWLCFAALLTYAAKTSPAP
ncbi:hypothetical protein [Streptomyces sp. F-3]|uniref:Uncharacterized protein n=2 Tax=Streptomyces TaxID=1883 RepID=A0ABP4DDD8_9ACTN|nr:hypothetical protein [Streptomyces sp. F-3]GAT83318.1 hypothetical protein [Streptomyces sp. F-3]